jgi:iron complex outermembrane receptor protein
MSGAANHNNNNDNKTTRPRGRNTMTNATRLNMSIPLLLISASTLALTAAAPTIALADDAEASSGAALQEVTVTARKREENILNVPAAVTAVSAAQLDRYSLRSIEEISANTPQLSVTRGSSGSGATISLRGIGSSSTSIGIEQSVAVIVDGVYYGQGRIINEGFFDMKQVEILKGPQALFFGKNATSGVLSFTSANPGHEFEALGRVSYEFTSRTPAVEAMVSGPISDTFGMRLAVRGSFMQGGYVENLAPATTLSTLNVHTFASTVHADPAPQKNVPAEKDLVARLTAQWKPTDKFELTLKAAADRYRVTDATWNDELILCPGVPPYTTVPVGHAQVHPTEACNKDWKIQQNDVPPDIAATNPLLGRHGGKLYQDYDSYSFTGNASYDAGPVKLTSVTGYHHFVNWFLGDYDFTGSANGGTWGTERSAYRAFSEEARAQSQLDGPFNFMAGVYYQSTRLNFHQQIIFPGALEDPLVADQSLRYITLEKVSHTNGSTVAGFAQAIWKPMENLEIAGGARYTHEIKDSVFNQPYVVSLYQAAFLQNAPFSDHQVFNDWSPEATITWHPASNWTVYGAYKQGFKSGGFSISALRSVFTTLGDLAFGPEKPRGVEGGVRATLFDGRVRASIDAYDYKYSGFQIDYFDASKIQFITANAGSAVTKGVEFQGEWAPARGLTLRGALAYNHSRYDTFIHAPCYGGQTPAEGCAISTFTLNGVTYTRPNQDLSGKPTANAPAWTGAVGADYDTPPFSGLVLGLSGNLRFSSSYLGGPFGNPNGRQGAFAVLDAAVRLRPENGRWELALIGKNLTNEYVFNSAGDAPSSGSGTGTALGVHSDLVATVNPPRTVAIQFSVHY